MSKPPRLAIVKPISVYLAVAVLGFAVGVLGLFVRKIRSGPCLEPWHTVQLEAEFKAGRSPEIRTFDDYLRLEDELFAELEDRVYSQIGTGPAYGLIRYSAGSRSDPGRWERNWNRSFELPAQNPAGGILGGQLEAAVPVALPATRIRSTACAVANQPVGGARADLGVDPIFELGEELVFQPQVVVEGPNLRATTGLELSLELHRVPRL